MQNLNQLIDKRLKLILSDGSKGEVLRIATLLEVLDRFICIQSDKSTEYWPINAIVRMEVLS